MAATTWPSGTASDVLSGAGAEAEHGGTMFWQRKRCVEQKGTSLSLEGNHNDSTPTNVDAGTWRAPPYARSGREIKVTVLIKNTGGGTSYFIARETGTTTDGTTQNTASASYVALTSVITIPDDTWGDTVKTIACRIYTDDTGTAYATSENLMLNVRLSDA